MSSATGRRWPTHWLVFVPLSLVLYALVVCAWQCDDAYITYRTVRNFWSGHGLRWNPDERVQAYTHPLWMWLAVGVYGLTRELYFSMLAVSAALSLSTVLALSRLAPSRWSWSVLAVTLAASCAFVEYGVSGLENPLLALLLVLQAIVSRLPPTPRTQLLGALGMSALFLTRPDAVLLVVPCWLGTLLQGPVNLRSLVLGFLPAFAWEVFSLVYYGALVPNTAIAKLNVDISSSRLALEGVRYLSHSALREPITLGATLLGAVYAFVLGARNERLLALGALLYLGYVVRIGGDFMTGRFLGAPLVVALCAAAMTAAARVDRDERAWRALLVGVLAYAILWPASPVRSTLSYGQGYQLEPIADERAQYYHWNGLLPVLVRYPKLQAAQLPVPWAFNVQQGLEYRLSDKRIVALASVGMFGYFAGDKLVIDKLGLADPLLSRIRFHAARGEFRIGHFFRRLPDGYMESRVLGRNLLTDPGLRAAYDDVLLATRAPLMAAGRFAAIWRLHTGYHAAALGSQPAH